MLAGYNNKQMMEALMPVLRLSEAGNLDLARTSDLVTDSLSSLGKTTADLPVYLDQVAKTAASSNTNIDALMEALIVCGGTVKNLNTPLDEANTLLGVLANRGIKGSEAGNSFNSILINLTSGAGQAGKAMEKLGLSAFDSSGKFKGVTQVLLELKQKTANMTEEQRNMYLSMIGGKTQITTLQALLSGVGEEYGDLRNKIQDSNGALNKMALTMQNNNKGSITQLKSAVEELAIKIYDVLKPKIAAATETLQKWTDKLNNLTPFQQETIVKIAELAAAIGPVILLISGIGGHISKTIKKINQLSVSISKAGGMMKWFKSPGMIVIAVIAALVVGAILLITHWDKVKECFMKVAHKISHATGISKQAVLKFVEVIKRFATIIVSKFTKAFASLKEKVGPKLNEFINTVKNAFNKLKPYLMPILAFLTGTFVAGIANTFSIVSTVISSAISTIGGIISGLLSIFSGIINFLVGVFTCNWSQAWEGVKQIFSGAVDIVKSLWNGVVSLLSAPVQAVVDILDSVFHDKIEKIKSAWESVKTFLAHPIQGTISLFKHGDLSGVKGQNALGTPYWGGGLSLVGEHGPEIVELPQGAAVHDTKNSKKMLSGGSSSPTIIIQNMNVREESDIDKIATSLFSKLQLASLNRA